MKRLSISLMLIIFTILSSCSDDSTAAFFFDTENSYYPLSIGTYWIYDTDYGKRKSEVIGIKKNGDQITVSMRSTFLSSGKVQEGNILVKNDCVFGEENQLDYIAKMNYDIDDTWKYNNFNCSVTKLGITRSVLDKTYTDVAEITFTAHGYTLKYYYAKGIGLVDMEGAKYKLIEYNIK